MTHNNQDLCRTYNVPIPAVRNLPSVSGPLLGCMAGLWGAANFGTSQLQQEITASCPREGALNWLMAQIFLTHFRLDQADRKTMLRKIYELSLKEGKDLDGQSIFEGAKKVFFNNLTEANRENVRGLPHYGLEEAIPFSRGVWSLKRSLGF